MAVAVAIAVGDTVERVVLWDGLLGSLLDDGTLLAGALTGALCGAVALVVHRLLVVLPAAGRAPGWLALAAAPLATTGIVGYVVLRLTLG